MRKKSSVLGLPKLLDILWTWSIECSTIRIIDSRVQKKSSKVEKNCFCFSNKQTLLSSCLMRFEPRQTSIFLRCFDNRNEQRTTNKSESEKERERKKPEGKKRRRKQSENDKSPLAFCMRVHTHTHTHTLSFFFRLLFEIFFSPI